ncbi:hypothetical protein JHK85_001751 [Glycine max]|nr:hypothetical protein JHK85_001751 [Glycine max]KAG5089098.1 hypothetical protein JHK86_001710 [Glycine max]
MDNLKLVDYVAYADKCPKYRISGTVVESVDIPRLAFKVGCQPSRRLPGGSPITCVSQVLVVAFRKKDASFGGNEFIGLYEVPGR